MKLNSPVLEINIGWSFSSTFDIDDVALIKELEEKRTAMMSDISEELQKRKEAMAGKVSHNMQRFVKAYPNLNRGYKLHKKYGFGRKNKDAE